MDTSNHTLSTLFSQLGLNNSTSDIEQFINKNRGVPAKTTLANASFWNQSQSRFLQSAIDEDSDWSEIVDTLDAMLR